MKQHAVITETPRRQWVAALSVVVMALSSSCQGATTHSALEPTGVQSAHVANLFWIFVWICTAVYVLVMIYVIRAAFFSGAKHASTSEPVLAPNVPRDKRMGIFIAGLLLLTTIILFYFTIRDYQTGKQVASLSDAPNPLRLRVTGKQWWWEIRYDDDVPSNIFTTANEIHIPVGRPIQIELTSNDVIHSFWIPNLHGKKDMIPGHPTMTWLQADKPGTYSGQCAEFCGLQHAHMRLDVVAESPEQFEAWISNQRQSSVQPQTQEQAIGQQVFLGSSCVMCHTIQGTVANGSVGPNLTHVGSRLRIAAGTLPNTRGSLGGWIADPQSIKPGVRMPQNNFNRTDLRSLIEYVQSLK